MNSHASLGFGLRRQITTLAALAIGPKHRAPLLALALPVLATPAMAQFNQTGAGPFEYTDTANWTGGTINNVWSSTLTADQTITFAADYTLVDPDAGGPATATLSLTNSGTFNQSFIGSGGNRTLTLGGGITLASNATNTNTVTLGSTTNGQQLNLNLGGSTRTLSVGTNRTLDVINTISGANGVIKTGLGTLRLTGTANSFTGVFAIGTSGQQSGVVEVTKLANGGQASSIGASSNATSSLSFGGTTAGGGTLRYIGSGDSTDRRFLIGSSGANFDASGTGALLWTNTGAPDVSPSAGSPRTITFRGTNTDGNTMAAAFANSGAGLTSIAKSGSGRWILSGNNTFTGNITIEAGTLELGSANSGGNGANVVLNGGTFATGGFGETFATLDVNGNATLDFGSGDSDLVFGASNGVSWGDSVSLSIINFTEGVDSIRFGTTLEGLSGIQLGKITINGLAAAIDEQGFLSPSAIPEPSTYAALAGMGGLVLALSRRQRPAR